MTVRWRKENHTMTHTQARRAVRTAGWGGALVLLALAALLAGAGVAHAVPPPDHNCLSPSGTNLNQLHGIEERIIGPPACREALAGERWVDAAAPWVTAARAAGAVYPAGYTPARPNPIDDFNAKFVGARYVLERGTRQEQTFRFGREALRTGLATEDGLPYSAPVSGVFHPLTVGRHTITLFITLSAAHCDGLGTDPELNCLPAGEIQWTPDIPFEVFPRRG
jgi:hypothetical protein